MKRFLFIWIFASLALATPPRTIPPEYYNEFTLNGEIPIYSFYRNDSYPPEHPLVYDFATLEQLKQKAIARESNYYGATDFYLYAALDRYRPHIEGKKVAVLGSTVPWYEAIVLAYGGKPVTIEYNSIISEHPDVKTLTPEQYEAAPELFDALISISSFEHDGLGRYGDPINPRGDLEAMQKAKRMLKERGILILAVPTGRDLLAWNAHRVYGAKRMPLLLEGWNILDTFGFDPSDFLREVQDHQPIFILTTKI